MTFTGNFSRNDGTKARQRYEKFVDAELTQLGDAEGVGYRPWIDQFYWKNKLSSEALKNDMLLFVC